jgi:hypothetical protein
MKQTCLSRRDAKGSALQRTERFEKFNCLVSRLHAYLFPPATQPENLRLPQTLTQYPLWFGTKNLSPFDHLYPATRAHDSGEDALPRTRLVARHDRTRSRRGREAGRSHYRGFG